LKNYTVPLKQLDSLKSIIVFSHKHNSLNKEKLLDSLELTKTVETDLIIDDYFVDPILKQFYTADMNVLLETYEPGKPEHKPKLMEQMKLMEDERNKRIEEHNKMLEAQQKIMNSLQRNTPVNKDIEVVKQHYEKLLSDKSYLINELLKKVKILTLELEQYKNNK
jgi:hypothetical protein